MNKLSSYRLSDDEYGTWLLNTIHAVGLKEFTEYETKVESALDTLRPGKYYDIKSDVPPDKQEMFIKITCRYIQRHPEIYFSNSYDKVYRYEQQILDARAEILRKRARRENDFSAAG